MAGKEDKVEIYGSYGKKMRERQELTKPLIADWPKRR